MMNGESNRETSCAPAGRPGALEVSLPVVASARPKVRPSRMSRWRALSLVLVHLLMIAHVGQWLWTGSTVSPIEPSEAMYTLDRGHVNAGFIFFSLAILATLLLGRFVCGWGCHFIAYQDLGTWLLKKLGIKPKALRSRLLVLAPLALALYMFVWPTVYRECVGAPRPKLTDHLVTADFWQTFPGPVVAVLTVLLAGFAIVYFLGSKGFCTYACPYGGFFGVVDKLAPGRIVVSDACEGCGHCTAVCTSNVRVHEEVARYGMVVDPGCMKCMDCVSVCPKHALSFGFARPSAGAKPTKAGRTIPYDFTLPEEMLMLIVGLGALLALRGLYDQVPLLLAMGLAMMTAFAVMKVVSLVRGANVRLQNLQLMRGGRLSRAGGAFAVATAVWLVFVAHSAAVQYHGWRGRALHASLDLGDDVWDSGDAAWTPASDADRQRLAAAIFHLNRADRWGLLTSPGVLRDLVWLYLAADRSGDAERTVRRLLDAWPSDAAYHRGLGGVLGKAGRLAEAAEAYRRALALEPTLAAGRRDLAAALHSLGRDEEAVALFREAIEVSSGDTSWRLALGQLLGELGRPGEARAEFEAALAVAPGDAQAHSLLGMTLMHLGEVDAGLGHLQNAVAAAPASADAHYNLAMALLGLQRIAEAIEHLLRATELRPDMHLAHYNLGVATFMDGRPGDAEPHIREALRLAPEDSDVHGFLSVVLRELGDARGADEAAARAAALRGGS